MSTANFSTMKNFPLIVADTCYSRFCPECGTANAAEGKVCEWCGHDISAVDAEYDELATRDVVEEMEQTAKRINEHLDFHEICVESGYYRGVQFYVKEKYDMDTLDNEDAHYYFGKCRSAARRACAREVNFICRELEKAKTELGLMRLVLTERFSNGECVYHIAG